MKSFSRLLVCAASIYVCFVEFAFVPTMAGRADEPRKLPNIVLIVADDLGARDLGCYGSKFHKTPRLDALAQQGVQFTSAYAACPVCSPSRCALLTGQYPQRFQITDWIPGQGTRPKHRLASAPLRNELPLSAVTLAEHLKKAGYVTAHIGKWHLGGEGFSPLEQGFDINLGGNAAGTPSSYIAPYAKKRPNGKASAMPGLEEAPDGEYLTDRLGQEAAKFIESHRDQPFFLYCPHFAVHTPMVAKPELTKKYPSDGGFGKQANSTYAAMLESLDDAVGKVLDKLAEHKLAENTLVLFTSDNGGLATLEGMKQPPTFNGPLREGKGYLYEGGIRVPCLAAWPGKIPAGEKCEAPIIGMDLFATVLDVCQQSLPADCDGRSLRPLWEKTTQSLHEDLYWHYPHYANQGSRPGGAVRSGNFKLIEYYETGRRELFDVASDVSESRNLASTKPEKVAELAAKLEAWRKSVGAIMPEKNPNYAPNPPENDGTINLPSNSALVYGEMLRFEPLPHKNTLGFWVNANDYATYDFTIDKPGKFTVEAWQGCGGGNGGSRVAFTVGEQTLELTVKETGGFQKFEPVSLGEFSFDKPGKYTLTVKPINKLKGAVMDLQRVVLKPVK